MTPYIATYLAYTLLNAVRVALAVSKSSLTAEQVPFNGGNGDTWLGLLDTLFLTTYALGSFASGWLVDRVSARTILVASMVVSALLCALVAVGVPSLVYFAFLFLALGLVQSAAWPACLALLGTRPTGLALGIWTTHGSLGGILGKAYGAVLLTHWHWPAVFLGMGLLCLVGSVVVALALRPVVTTTQGVVEAPTTGFWQVFWGTPHLLAFSACFFFVKLTVYCLMGWLPTYLTTLGYSSTNANLLATVYDLGGIVSGIGAGYWMDRTGQAAGICVKALGLGALTLLLYLLYGNVHVGVQILLLFAVGLTLNVPYVLISGKISADLGDQHPSTKSTITGIVNGCGGLGAALQGIGVGILGGTVPWSWILGIICLCTLASALCLLRMAWRESQNTNGTYTLTTPMTDLTTLQLPPGTITLIATNIGLRSLRGCPATLITANFSGNALTTLEDLPANSALISLDVSYNRLTSLKGLPPKIQNLRASRNRITSLKDIASHTTLHNLGISCNHLANMEGCPLTVRSMVCTNNFLRSWVGFPPTMDKLYASYNQIPDLLGAPVVKNFDCSCNLIRSLVGCPEGVEEFNCCNNSLTSLEGCPSSVKLLYCSGNPLELIETTKNPLTL